MRAVVREEARDYGEHGEGRERAPPAQADRRQGGDRQAADPEDVAREGGRGRRGERIEQRIRAFGDDGARQQLELAQLERHGMSQPRRSGDRRGNEAGGGDSQNAPASLHRQRQREEDCHRRLGHRQRENNARRCRRSVVAPPQQLEQHDGERRGDDQAVLALRQRVVVRTDGERRKNDERAGGPGSGSGTDDGQRRDDDEGGGVQRGQVDARGPLAQRRHDRELDWIGPRRQRAVRVLEAVRPRRVGAGSPSARVGGIDREQLLRERRDAIEEVRGLDAAVAEIGDRARRLLDCEEVEALGEVDAADHGQQRDHRPAQRR
ncbi:MAG TPA: hypothetical protein VKD69_24025 [Vicinamibacterales bacterium]|nr:hypothetical protein [Vicinamibacterales bacterium]